MRNFAHKEPHSFLELKNLIDSNVFFSRIPQFRLIRAINWLLQLLSSWDLCHRYLSSLPKIPRYLIFLLNCHLLKVHSTTFLWCPPRWEHVSSNGDALPASLPQRCLCNRLAELWIICNFLSHCFDMESSSKALFIKFLHPWHYLESALRCIHKKVEITLT